MSGVHHKDYGARNTQGECNECKNEYKEKCGDDCKDPCYINRRRKKLAPSFEL